MSRRGFTVALVGPDGAGKTTICRKLIAQIPWAKTYMYMGINQDACNVLLPTTWLWLRVKKLFGMHRSMGGPPPIRTEEPPRRTSPLRTLKSLLRTMNLLAEEWFRQMLCSFAVYSGKIVVMDRHFVLDYYAHDLSPTNRHRTIANRIHGCLLRRFPVPDLIILLDMSPEQLFRRKAEGSVEALARRRQEYLALRNTFPHFVTLDASLPLDVVVRMSLDAITVFHAKRDQCVLPAFLPSVERTHA